MRVSKCNFFYNVRQMSKLLKQNLMSTNLTNLRNREVLGMKIYSFFFLSFFLGPHLWQYGSSQAMV